jgi:hypothetical protein
MKIQSRLIVGLAAVLAVVGWWYYSHETIKDRAVDLIAALPDAEKRSNPDPLTSNFQVADVTIDGVTRKAILAKPFARITYTIRIAPDAWLDVDFAMRPDSWPLPGDGAQFRVGVSQGRTYDELLRQYVNPKAGGRRWFSAHLDLSAYEGREVRIILSTDPSPKGGGDAKNDFAVWAEPHVYSRR